MKKLLPVLFILLFLAGCSNAPATAASPTADNLTGRLTFAGSTTMQPLVSQLADAFTVLHPNVSMDIAAGGSNVGIKAVHDGTADIGMASRELTAEEASSITPTTVAIDVLAIVVHKDNPVQSLTLQQLADIYNGQVTNWKDLGGLDQEIVPVQRESSSGSRGAFEELVLEKQAASAPNLQTAVTAGDVAATISTEEGAIGYVGFGNLEDSLKLLAINNVTPSQETAKDGTYPLIRPLTLMTGPLSQPLAQKFVDFAMSDQGQQLINSLGWIPVK